LQFDAIEKKNQQKTYKIKISFTHSSVSFQA